MAKAKAKKITKNELGKIQENVNATTNFYAAIGRSLVGILKSMPELEKLEAQLMEEQRVLEDKYGSINIDLRTGEYTEEVVAE